jgi:hypothetical protein
MSSIAYKSKARATHPDKNPGNDDASDMFSKIANAYESICRSLEHRDAAPRTPTSRASRVRSRSPIAVQRLTEEQKMVYGDLCRRCHQTGHWAKECPYASGPGACFYCKRPGHYAAAYIYIYIYIYML